MTDRYRLAVVASHPIQYQGPWFRLLAAHPAVELTVYFCCDHGMRASYDKEFNATFAWSRPLTEGYNFEVVRSLHPQPAPYGFWPCTNPGLWQRLRPENFDAVLVLGWGFASCWLATRAAKAHGLQVLVRGESNHGTYEPRTPLKKLMRGAALRTFFAHGDAFLAIGQRNADFYRSFGVPKEDIFLAPYAVDNDFFTAERLRLAPRRKAFRRALGVLDDRPILISSGKLIPRKAPLDLVEAFARVRPHCPARLVFAGDGPLREAVEARAAALGMGSDVLVAGFKQQDELCELYVASDLFVFPTRFETWGLVMNEAMLFGLPVICTTQTSGSADLIRPGETGDVYETGDIPTLSRLLREYLADPARLRRMGEAAQSLIGQWNLNRCVESTVNALRHVTRKRSGAAAAARAV